MQFRSLAAGIALVLLATLVAPVNVAQATAPAPPAPGIVLSATEVMVQEELSGRAYKVRLGTIPTSDVTVALTVAAVAPTDANTAELFLGKTSLTFTKDNYNVDQSVPVAAAPAASDNVLEGTHVFRITHTATSSDPVYGGSAAGPAATAQLTVHLADNDAGVLVTQSGGSTAIVEGGATDSFTVVLGSAPSGTATVHLIPNDGSQLTLDRFHLPFGAVASDPVTEWYKAVTVTVSAINDDVVEAALSRSIAVTASGNGPYSSPTLPSIPVSITDPDAAGISLTRPTGVTTYNIPNVNNDPAAGATSEAAATNAGSYRVALTSQPTGTVAVAITSSPAGNVTISSPAGTVTPGTTTLTFSPSNWNVAQAVTVNAVQDRVDEGANNAVLSVSLVHHASGADYGGAPDKTAVFRYMDDDDAGFRYDEAAATATPPFTAAGPMMLTEGAAGQAYDLRLNSQPTSPVTVGFAGNAQFSVTPASHVFDASNWDSDVTVTATAVDDAVDEADFNGFLVQTVSTSDPFYQADLADLPVRVFDNDLAGIQVSPAGAVPITENGANQTFKVRLATQPTAPITVSLTTGDQLSASPGFLTFTGGANGDWNVWQNVTVTAVDDEVSEVQQQDAVTLSAGGDAVYAGLDPVDVLFDVLDDDGVAIIEESGGRTTATENVQATSPAVDRYSIRLVTAPTDPVNLTVTVPAGSGLKVNGADTVTLRFLPAVPDGTTSLVDLVQATVAGVAGHVDLNQVESNSGTPWNVEQFVTVTAPANDQAPTAPRAWNVTHAVSSKDARFDAASGALVRQVVVTRLDDDAGILVEETGAGTEVTEGGATDSYVVRLSKKPTGGSVNVLLGHDGQVTLSGDAFGDTLFFDQSTWDLPQTVRVTAVQDSADEDDQVQSTITHTASTNDGGYKGKTGPDVVVTVNDGDLPGLVVAQTGGSTAVTEGGATDSYTLALNAKPSSPVTVSLSALPAGRVTLSAASVTFQPSQWNVPQTVTVTAVNDNVSEGPQSAAIHHSVSGPTGWSGLAVADVSVAITDNDAPGLVVTSTGGPSQPDKVYENGPGDGFNVRLASQPVSPVTVRVTSSDSQLFVQSPTLTFDADNWNQVQVAWFSAFNDAVVQGDRTATITFTVTGGDANYVALSPVTRTMQIDDDDA